MPISRPRMVASSRSRRVSRSRLPNRTAPDRMNGRGTKAAIERSSVVFPDPLSPTTAIASPRSMRMLTSRKAGTGACGLPNVTESPVTSARGSPVRMPGPRAAVLSLSVTAVPDHHGARGGSGHLAGTRPGVEHVAERIADEVEKQHGHHDGKRREYGLPPVAEQDLVAPVIEYVPPPCARRRLPRAEERHRCLGAAGQRDRLLRLHHPRPRDIRQQV